ncbi:helix-turn-helix domain-containing protein [Enterococcus sp. DIV0187]|uniref:helix-turn-helix domain-containing protein n=1 Tax=Enterococcus sp. DIV0187 TaxID=2774644 RepID=UPI003F21BCE3
MISIQRVNYFNHLRFPEQTILHSGLSLIIRNQDSSINRNFPAFFLLQKSCKSKLNPNDRVLGVLQILLDFSHVLKKTEFLVPLKSTREIDQIICLLFTYYLQEKTNYSVDQIIILLVNRVFKANSEILNNDHTFNKLLKFMEENICESLQVTDFCSKVHLSESSLNRLCKKQIGMTATKLFRKIQCQEAGRLLMDTSLTIQEISEKLGFKNSKHFSTMFKKNEGISPIEKRKNLEEINYERARTNLSSNDINFERNQFVIGKL